ncbi:hypothetical protein J4476_00240 [Candidatus Woesearchaeota archaeon]|nr:MAG: hypothetical protein QT09_C0010G0023 [archaeon GW2011_AR18]MBS3161113.1 hypothetical protein [Candidatus Woesearchaeota archaeon]HIH25523.1 hypothetical protein [Nanoarchaeota archaeon]
MKKKAILGVTPEILVGIIVAVMFIIGLVFIAAPKLIKLLPGQQSSNECSNIAEWNNIKSVLEKFDSSELSSSESPFYNKECNLVSFTLSQGLGKIKPAFNINSESQLCLCNIEDDLCRQSSCYILKNFNAINSQQFETSDFKDYLILKFVKDGKTLLINPIGDKKEPEPILYSYSEQFKIFDESNIVNSLTLEFKSTEVNSFIPLVESKQPEQFNPVGVTIVPGFTSYFSIKIIKPVEDLPLSSVKSNPEFIDNNAVAFAHVVLNIPSEKLALINDEPAIYYLTDDWHSSQLSCVKDTEKNSLCSADIDGFSNDFILSVKPGAT